MSDEYNGLFFDGIIDTKCVYVASRLGCESFVLLQYFISSDLNALDIDAAIYNRTEQGHLCARPRPAHPHLCAGVFTPWTRSRHSING